MIRKIINDLACDKITLSKALTMAKIIASDIKNETFKQWIKSELEKQCTALMIVIPKEVNEKYCDLQKSFNGKSKSTAVKMGRDKQVFDKGFQSGKDAVKQRGIEGGK